MRETILTNLHQLEKDYHIRLLYACEAGSRAWGLHSPKSDYDVRFIYLYPMEHYLSIDPVGTGKKKDVIDVPIDEGLDMHGWDLTKALKLFRKSNPSLLEWLHSEIIYYQAFSTINQMKELEELIFSSKSCIHHYLNMAKSNFSLDLNPDERKIKIYLNTLRPLLLAKWIRKQNQFPPLVFQKIVDDVVLEDDIKESILSLLHLKMGKNVKFTTAMNHTLNSYIVHELAQLEQDVRKLKNPRRKQITKSMDSIFQSSIYEVWNNHS